MKKLATILSLAMACAFVAPQAMAKTGGQKHKAAVVKAEKSEKRVTSPTAKKGPISRRKNKQA